MRPRKNCCEKHGIAARSIAAVASSIRCEVDSAQDSGHLTRYVIGVISGAHVVKQDRQRQRCWMAAIRRQLEQAGLADRIIAGPFLAAGRTGALPTATWPNLHSAATIAVGHLLIDKALDVMDTIESIMGVKGCIP